MNRPDPWSSAVLFRLHQLCNEIPRPAYYRMARILNAEFGLSLTANACIGKTYRLGRQPVEPAPPVSPALAILLPIQPIEAEIDPPLPDEVGLSIYQLRSDSCRWPFGDHAPFRFCGVKVPEPGPGEMPSPYCDEHHARAYTTPKQRWE